MNCPDLAGSFNYCSLSGSGDWSFIMLCQGRNRKSISGVFSLFLSISFPVVVFLPILLPVCHPFPLATKRPLNTIVEGLWERCKLAQR